ncbi:MAG: gfo/Idh/MocA family oxidoreductase, partial [Actinobacteria bacterium]|nr:gfo/Idh/MocA family oxidoreductase [Actinomycetota bacterium]
STTRIVSRSPEELSPGALKYAKLPPGHPQGFQDCFNAFVGDFYEAVRGAYPDGLPNFADGRRAAQLTEAVLTSASSRSWVEVAPPPATVATGGGARAGRPS